LKTVDEQRQEDVATPENAEDPMIDPTTSDDRSTKLLELLGSEQDPSFFDDDGLPSGENNSDYDVPSDESNSDLGRESTPASPASQTLSRVHIVTPLRGTDRDGDCEANAGTERTVDANQEIAPLPLPPVLGRTQLVDSALSGSMYISSDDESDQLNEDQSETHSDGMPVPKNDATAISEQESVSSALPEIRPSEVDIGSIERIRDEPPSDGLKNPMAQSEDLVDILEAIEVNLVQQHHNREADSTPQEPIQDAPAPSWPPSNPPKADLAPRSQVARILSNRSRLVMALSSPFRRTRSKKSLVSGTLSALDEDKEVSEFISDTKLDNRQTGMDMSESFEGAPVSYIAMRKRSAADEGGDDESLVSQITFKWEECKPQKSTNDNQWWWGVTAEGLEGWFPTSYVHQAVVAAEGFLSARAIHEKVKNRPLDFESDEESEFSESEFDVISGDQSKVPSPSTKRGKPEKLDCGPDHKVKEAAVQATDGKDQSTGSSSKRKTTLAFQIEEKQAYLEDQSTTCEIGDSTTAIILFELASLQSKNGEFGEALKNLQQALQLQKAGKNTEDACRTLQLMADINSRAKYYQAALSCYAEARKIQEAVNGYYHEEVANILNRQGNVLARQGEFDLAMENHKEALRILKECCGEEVKNPLVSQTLIQIGAVYYKERNSLKTIQKNRDGYTTFIESGMLEVIGRAHEDRGSYRMAIAFFEEKLQCLNNEKKSDDRQQIADTLNSLGMLSCRAGLYLEAMDYYAQALGILKELGCDDVQLAKAKVLSANVQYFLGHFEKALKLLEAALHVMRAKAGMEHETVAGTLFHIGVANIALGNFSIGMSNLREAIKIQTKILGSEHPATLRTRREIANLLVSWESNVDLALQEYRAILEIQRRIHGSKHPNIAETLHFIGCAEAKNGDKDLALRTLEDCYNMRLEFLGTDHPLQATTLHKIAKIRLQKGRVKKAIHICNSALQIRKEALSENHVDVAGLLATKASCLLARGSYNEANKLFLEASSITREAVGTSHPAFADVQVQVGAMHLRTCHFEEAAAAISAALDIYRKSGLNEDHPAIKGALEELEKVERAEMLCV
jgi:tetratricopeptide (TPR) repeat protein